MSRRSWIVVLASAALVVLSAPAGAQTEYFGQVGFGNFGSALGDGPSNLVTFSEVSFPSGTNGINGINGSHPNYTAAGVNMVQRDGALMNILGVPTSSPTAPAIFAGDAFFPRVITCTTRFGGGSNQNLSDNIDFVFQQTTTAAGLFIGSIDAGASTEVQFLAADNSIIASEVFTQAHLGMEFIGSGNRIFYGVTTSTPIARIRTVEPANDGHGVVYSYLLWGQSLEAGGGGGDTDPPVVTIDTPSAGTVVGASSVFVHATITDASVTVVTSTPPGVDAILPTGGGEAFGFVPLFLEGENIITVNAEDAPGNPGGSSVTVIRDTIAPTIMITSPTNDAIVGINAVTVFVSIVDATATRVIIGSSPEFPIPAGGGPASFSVTLAPGVNLIAVNAIDAGGNESQATVSVTYDASAPQVTINSPADNATFGPGESSIVVNASVSDESATTVVSIPSGIDTNLLPGGGPVSGTVAMAEGSNSISVTATDAFGRTGQAFVSVLLDTTAPNVVLESPLDGANVRGTIDLHASAEDVLPGTGIARVEFRVDGNLHATVTDDPYEIAFDTAMLADGFHSFTAVAVDGKGNSASASATVRVDNTPPTVVITTPANGAVVSGPEAFVASVADGGSGVKSVTMLANGGAPDTDGSTAYNPPVASDLPASQVATTLLPDGSLVLTATAKDAAGNEATASITVIVDNTAPQKMLITPTDGSIVSGPLLIQAAATDPNFASLSLLLNDVLFLTTTDPTISTTVQTTSMPDGPLKITIVALDLGGNMSSCEATVTVDNLVFKLNPQTLNLKSKGGANSVTAHVFGSNVALLIPTELRAIELRVPGGSPVPSTQGWPGDDSVTMNGGVPELTIKFDRTALITAIRAGIAGGQIPAAGPVNVSLVSGGRVLGTDSVNIVGQ